MAKRSPEEPLTKAEPEKTGEYKPPQVPFFASEIES